jgi:uncharacterized membrane protein YbhN (UPF0104 family)
VTSADAPVQDYSGLVAAPLAPRAERRSAWRTVIFAPVGDGSTRRRAPDVVQLGLAVLLVAAVVYLVTNHGHFDVGFEKDVTPPPRGTEWLLSALWVLGSFGAMFGVLVIALISRRLRLARDVLIAGFGSLLVCLALSAWVGPDGGRPAGVNLGGIDPALPITRIAVAVAVALVIAPYLSRWCRRAVLTLVALSAAAAVFQGHGFVLDLVASLAVGWGTASALHVGFGSPKGLPSTSDVTQAAADLGLDLSGVEPADVQVWGVARFTGVAGTTPVDISVYGRDASDAQMFAKMWRFAWYQDSGPTLSFTRLQQVEHEAYLALAAQHAGVDAPEVLVAAVAEAEKLVVLVTRPPSGQRLADIDPGEIDDARIDALYGQIALLRTARLAHGGISGTTLMLSTDGTAGVCDFRAGSSSAPTDRLNRDLAGAMVTVAQLAGPQRSVDAAVRAVGQPTVASALAQVQPAALAPEVRHAVAGRKSQKQLLADVRDLGAKATGVEAPKLTEIHRVSLSGLLMSVGALLGLTLVVREVTGIGDVWATLKTAALIWVFAAFAVAQSTNLAQAWAVQGSVSSSLPFGPTLGLELANAYTGLIGGSVGTTATIIRYFQRRGLAVSVAVSSGVLVSLAGTAVELVLFAICFLLTKGDFNWAFQTSSHSGGGSSTHWWILSIIVLVIVAIGAVTIVPSFRHKVIDKVKPQLQDAKDNLRDLGSQPGKLARLFAGSAISQVLFAITLGCALHAYGASLSLAMLIVINTVAGILGGLAPVPGGIGVIEAGLIAGFVAAGVPSTVAVAATITARLFTCYLPPLWGYPTIIWMRRHEYL